jgi:hypothetical protein
MSKDKPIEWIIAQDRPSEETENIDALFNTDQNSIVNAGTRILYAFAMTGNLATMAYAALKIKYGIAAESDRIIGLAAMTLFVSGAMGYIISRERQRT